MRSPALLLGLPLLCGAIAATAAPASLPVSKFRGAWDASANYGRGQIVIHRGASYISLKNKNRHQEPDRAPTYWAGLVTAGSSGKDGVDGQDGKDGAKGDPGVSFNPLRIAAQRWYGASRTGLSYPVGDAPVAAAFDGSYLWIANRNEASVAKLRPSDGSIQGRYSLEGAKPNDILYDGSYLWVATDSGLVQLSAADGAILRSVVAGAEPSALTFDGESVWVASGNGAYKVKVVDGTVQGPFVAGERPSGIAFDGSHIWVASSTDSTFTRLNGEGAEVSAIHWLGGNLRSVAFDGTHMWVLKSDPEGLVTQVRISDSVTLGNYPVGPHPTGVVFDGTHIWVCSSESHTVTKLNAGDGAAVATYPLDPVATSPYGLAFDGVNIWVLHKDHDAASKL